jgi:hypothetical protein
MVCFGHRRTNLSGANHQRDGLPQTATHIPSGGGGSSRRSSRRSATTATRGRSATDQPRRRATTAAGLPDLAVRSNPRVRRVSQVTASAESGLAPTDLDCYERDQRRGGQGCACGPRGTATPIAPHPRGLLATPPRHRRAAWLHTAASAFGVARGNGLVHSVSEAAVVVVVVVVFALLAAHPAMGQRARSAAAVLGLITSSAILAHLSGGVIEMHFHCFEMLGVITLYQDWLPFGLALGYVVVHHSVLGLLAPAPGVQPPGGLAAAVEVGAHPRRVRAGRKRRLPGHLAAQRDPGHRDSRLVSRLEGLAHTDPLTGVPNRRVGDEERPRPWPAPGWRAPRPRAGTPRPRGRGGCRRARPIWSGRTAP